MDRSIPLTADSAPCVSRTKRLFLLNSLSAVATTLPSLKLPGLDDSQRATKSDWRMGPKGGGRLPLGTRFVAAKRWRAPRACPGLVGGSCEAISSALGVATTATAATACCCSCCCCWGAASTTVEKPRAHPPTTPSPSLGVM